MNRDERDRLVSKLIQMPTERTEILRDAGLNEDDKIEVASLAETADLLWERAHGAPPLADDPVAAMLGLIADPHCTLDPPSLARARKRVGMKLSQLTETLRNRGWDIQQSDVFRWETRSASDVVPALVQAVADVLGAPVDSLIASPGRDAGQDTYAAIRRSPVFQKLVDRWARAQRVSLTVAAAALETRMIATVHRGDHPDEQQLLRSLDTLVTAIENKDQT